MKKHGKQWEIERKWERIRIERIRERTRGFGRGMEADGTEQVALGRG